MRRYNAKLTRVGNSNPNIKQFLPERVTVAGLRESIQTRRDFNNQLNSLARFQNRNATELIQSDTGNIVTRYERQEIAYKVAAINRRRASRRNEILDAGEQSFTMGSIESNNLKPKRFEFNEIRPGKEWEKFVESVNAQSSDTYFARRNEMYKQNYLKSVRENLGEAGAELYNLIESLPADLLVDAYYDDPVLQVQFTSDPLPASFIAQQSLERWRSFLEDNS